MTRLIAALAILPFLAGPAIADTTRATCLVVPNGTTEAIASGPCLFYQAQGHVVITLKGGDEFDLTPTEGYGTYVDAEGRAVERTEELGEAGNAYRYDDVTVYVYW